MRKGKIQSGKAPIYLKVTVGNDHFELSTKQCIDPAKWNAEGQKVSGSSEEIRGINSYLKNIAKEVYEAHDLLLREEKEITALNLKNRVLGLDSGRRFILEIFQEHNDKMKALVGKEFAQGTLDRYETSLRHTKSFLQWKYNVPDMDITKLNYEFVENYEFWLKTVRHCDHNTTMKYLSNFKKIVRRCVRNGWLSKDPFDGFMLAVREVKRTALTEEELERIKGKNFHSERVQRVRDIFLFSCYTGLAYADVKKLRPAEIGKGIDGADWIFTRREKTDTESRVPLLAEAIAILEKYKNNPICTNQDRVLPVLSNQKMNEYLKEIADICQIDKTLTCHLARHTFATTITLANGVPMETVSKLLGHKNLKTTQQYAKVLDLKISRDMAKLRVQQAGK